MKILHTADWHLGRRQKRIDRSDDLRRAIGRVMELCESREVDALVIAGDLFDDVCRPDDVCSSLEMLKAAFGPFLRRGGTILAVPGNHDRETFCKTIGHAFDLVDPTENRQGDRLSNGRFHLFQRPAVHRLADRSDQEVQFVLMPYPLASRYFDDAEPDYRGGAEGRHRRLLEKFFDTLARMRSSRYFDDRLHSVLVGHMFLQGATLPGGRVISGDDEKQDVVCPANGLGDGWAYVALGHVHRPQTLGGLDHVRYAGSIERLAFDERDDSKEVVLLEIGPEGLQGRPEPILLDPTPFLDVEVSDPCVELPGLRDRHPDAPGALVRCRVAYTAGIDNPDEIRRRIFEVFPRCYDCELVEASRVSTRSGLARVERRCFRDTVMGYLRENLEGEPIAEAVLAEAEELIREVRP